MFKGIMAVLASACIMLTGAATAGAAYPERPIQFIIGWSVGGSSDQAGRALCVRAEQHLKQPLIVQNLPAGAGAKGYMTISKAKPDGYTIGLATSTISTVKPSGLLPLDSRDFEVVMTFESGPGGVWVHKDAPWKDLREFLEHAKKNPGQVSIAASTPGSITRYQCLLFELEGGVQFKIISQKGGGSPGLTALAGKHVDAAMGSPMEGYALYTAGQIRPLCFTSEERMSIMPDVPTAKELGYNVVLSSTRTILAPKGTPKAIVDALYQAFSKVVNDPEYRRQLEAKGSIPLDLNPAETAKFLEKQDALFKNIIEKTSTKK